MLSSLSWTFAARNYAHAFKLRIILGEIQLQHFHGLHFVFHSVVNYLRGDACRSRRDDSFIKQIFEIAFRERNKTSLNAVNASAVTGKEPRQVNPMTSRSALARSDIDTFPNVCQSIPLFSHICAEENGKLWMFDPRLISFPVFRCLQSPSAARP